MKVSICLKCHKVFENDFLYCPYCGKKLNRVNVEDEEKTRVKSTAPVVSKLSEPEDFYDSLLNTQQAFIQSVFNKLKKEYPDFNVSFRKHYVSFYQSSDIKLNNYGNWFYFTYNDSKFVFKYRSTPNKSLDTKEIKITKNTTVDQILNVIYYTIENRSNGGKTLNKDNNKKTAPINDKKEGLVKHSNHSSIVLAGDHPEDLFYGTDFNVGERKTQKEVWEVSKPHKYSKKDY